MSGYSSDGFEHLSDVEQEVISQKVEEVSETHQEHRVECSEAKNDAKEDGTEDVPEVSINNVQEKELHLLIKMMHENMDNQSLLMKINELTTKNQKMQDLMIDMERSRNFYEEQMSRERKECRALEDVQRELRDALSKQHAKMAKTERVCRELKYDLEMMTYKKEARETELEAMTTANEALRKSEESERGAKEEFEQKAKELEEEMLTLKTSKLEADLVMEKLKEKLTANSNGKVIEQGEAVLQTVDTLTANLDSMKNKLKKSDRMNEELEKTKKEFRQINEKLKAEKKSIITKLCEERREFIKYIDYNLKRIKFVFIFFLIFALLVLFNVFYFLLKL